MISISDIPVLVIVAIIILFNHTSIFVVNNIGIIIISSINLIFVVFNIILTTDTIIRVITNNVFSR